MAQEQPKMHRVSITKVVNGYFVESNPPSDFGASLLSDIHVAKSMAEVAQIADKLLGKLEEKAK